MFDEYAVENVGSKSRVEPRENENTVEDDSVTPAVERCAAYHGVENRDRLFGYRDEDCDDVLTEAQNATAVEDAELDCERLMCKALQITD